MDRDREGMLEMTPPEEHGHDEAIPSLDALGITLPPYRPLPSSLPFETHVRDGTILYLSGHISDIDGEPQLRGQLGGGLSVEEGREAARSVMRNLLATLQHAAGGLRNVAAVLRLLGMVNSAPGFTDQPGVVNAASEMLVAALGRQRGVHARSAIGVAQLPFGVPVEIELTVRLRKEPT